MLFRSRYEITWPFFQFRYGSLYPSRGYRKECRSAHFSCRVIFLQRLRAVTSRRAPRSGQGGFTLLEVLAAVLILGLAYVAVLENFSISLRNIDKVRRTRQAVFADLITFSGNAKFTGDTSLEPDEKEEGVLFMEGEKYKLMVVTSDNGELATLKLQPIL